MKIRSAKFAVAAAASALLIAGILLGDRNLFGQGDIKKVAQTVRPVELTGQPVTFDIFRKIAGRMNQTVVNINTTQIVEGIDPHAEFFGTDPFLRRFFGELPEGPQRQNALGSGVIIDSQGFILTNNHVVEKADEIRVSLQDEDLPGRGVEAKVIGRDPKTDLALIQIEGQTGLTAAPLGNSDQLQIGDWVIAIGNPFNLGHTVTVGVVSAKGRALGGPYDDFIQTDASINPGNSGGPLLNSNGEVVGINSAIASSTGQSAGIGFAIPINIAKSIVPQLRQAGKVIRGQLGVGVQTLANEELIRQFGAEHGAVVTEVTEGSSAEKAGIQRGDVIIEYDSKEIKDGRDLSKVVAETRPGTSVELKVVRDKEEKTLTATIQEMENPEAASDRGPEKQPGGLGLTVSNLDARSARQLQLEVNEGVLVTGVEVNTPAEKAGLQRGDVILEIDRQPVRNTREFREKTRAAKPGASLLFLVQRSGTAVFIAVPIPEP